MTDAQREVSSNVAAWGTGLRFIDRIVHLIKQLGAGSEAQTDRNGFLSHHEETHAVASGLGIGFTGAASDNWRLLGGILTAVIYGNRGDALLGAKLFEDIKNELHYFVAALACGAVLGLCARLATRG